MQTSTNPMQTTTNPMQTPTNPMQTSTNPMQTSTNPMQTSTNPMQTSTNPMQTSTKPYTNINKVLCITPGKPDVVLSTEEGTPVKPIKLTDNQDKTFNVAFTPVGEKPLTAQVWNSFFYKTFEKKSSRTNCVLLDE